MWPPPPWSYLPLVAMAVFGLYFDLALEWQLPPWVRGERALYAWARAIVVHVVFSYLSMGLVACGGAVWALSPDVPDARAAEVGARLRVFVCCWTGFLFLATAVAECCILVARGYLALGLGFVGVLAPPVFWLCAREFFLFRGRAPNVF
jgi:hypothetical protein